MDQLASLSTILSEMRGVNAELKADTSFDELNMDEYDIVDFLMNVEEKIGISFDNAELLEVKTISDVMDMIDKNNQEELSKC